MRNHAWMAIVEGARGLWWWSLGDNALLAVCAGWCAQKTGYMNNLKAVSTRSPRWSRAGRR